MTRKLLLALAAAAIAAGVVLALRGGKSPHRAAATVAVRAYFYRGSGLVPVTVRVPRTRAVARAALHALLAPPTGYRTTLPHGAKLGVRIAGGTATVSPSPSARRTAWAQVVFTLTQFPSVRRVAIGSRPAAVRADYADLTPDALIFVESPRRDSTVTSPVAVSGTAVAFEATVALEVWRGGKLRGRLSLTASEGAPQRGRFATKLVLEPGAYRLVFYEPSAEDGSHLHTTTVDVRVRR